jgi:hypothetical protein
VMRRTWTERRCTSTDKFLSVLAYPTQTHDSI